MDKIDRLNEELNLFLDKVHDKVCEYEGMTLCSECIHDKVCRYKDLTIYTANIIVENYRDNDIKMLKIPIKNYTLYEVMRILCNEYKKRDDENDQE